MAKQTFEMTFAGRPLVVEVGQVAKQANGAVVVRYGDTTVLSTAVMSILPLPDQLSAMNIRQRTGYSRFIAHRPLAVHMQYLSRHTFCPSKSRKSLSRQFDHRFFHRPDTHKGLILPI